MGVDYLQKYVTAEGLDFPRLLNDDFFLPIKLLYNHRHYASATKLLLSFIDTVGFIEFGETKSNVFTLWLDAYADLTPVGVTAAELWELRKSLLHMSNLNSRRVQAGHVKALISYVGQLPANIARETATAKYYGWNELLNAVARACER